MSIRLSGVYYNPQTAADEIGCSKGRVCQLAREGSIDVVYISDKIYLIPEREVRRIKGTEATTGRPRGRRAS